MTTNKTARASIPKTKTGFEYDVNCPRIISLRNGDVILRNPLTGCNERLRASILDGQAFIAIPSELEGHPSYPQISAAIEATGRVAADVSMLVEALQVLACDDEELDVA
jgi:hypothetical protein